MIILDKKSFGDRREIARTQSEIVGTLHIHSTGSVRFPIKSVWIPYDFRTISLPFPYGSDPERQQKPEQEIVRCSYEL